ncbi:MAG: hypothetical protein KAR42_02600, partial [candidate division Zixibacteria bacterium]|nr:hypothetical protein [candidate division Zixibacteria bacterium]
EADNSPQLLPVTLTMIKLPPHITTDPIVFSVSAVQGGANPADRFLTISTDVPGSELSWSVSNIESWLSLAPVSGTPPDEVTLSFDITGLSYGYYYDTVTVTDPNATNSPRKVPVTLQIVSDLPVMELEPEILHIVAKVGENPAGRSVYLSNSGEGSMTFEVQENSDIISNVMPLNGTAPANIIFSFETDTLAFGDYYDTVVIVSPEAVNSPRELIIHYHIAFNPPDLYIIPFSTSINYFECWQGMNNTPPKKYFQIENHGGGNLVWYAKYDSDWLELEYDSASNELLNSITLTENVNLLPVGVYTDTITVYSDVAMNSPKKISVTLNVIPGNQTPEIYNDLTAIDIPIQEVFGFLLGELAALGDVINVNAGCMDYWIEEDVPWLTIIDSVGEAPAYITAIVDVGSYTYGSYPDSILIYSSTASNSPQVIHLNLQVWRLLGDHDWNNEINLGDVVQMINYIFKYGPEAQPEPLVANTNCDFFVDLSDVIVLINYIFKGGNKPCGNL